MFQALARDRLERLNASPSATPWTYFRAYSALLLVFSVDLLWYFTIPFILHLWLEIHFDPKLKNKNIVGGVIFWNVSATQATLEDYKFVQIDKNKNISYEKWISPFDVFFTYVFLIGKTGNYLSHKRVIL